MSQHKDTAMLLLESKNEGGLHAWDVPHPEMDRTDPADNANCALASIAMINAYFGGDLSQDGVLRPPAALTRCSPVRERCGTSHERWRRHTEEYNDGRRRGEGTDL